MGLKSLGDKELTFQPLSNNEERWCMALGLDFISWHMPPRESCLLKNDYRSVIGYIDVIFILIFFGHKVVILTCNKDDVRCRKPSK